VAVLREEAMRFVDNDKGGGRAVGGRTVATDRDS
jgi:hypothetical protein